MKYAIIVDSTAGLPDSLINLPNIFHIDLTLHFPDGFSMVDTVDPEKNHLFYQKLSESNTLPTTSQPPIGEYYQLVEKIIEMGYQGIIAVHLTSGISGTFQNAKTVLSEYQDQIESYVVDSKSTSVAMEHIVQEILRMMDHNMTLADIYQECLWIAKKTRILFMVQDLHNLTKGGRLSSSQAFFGNVLKIKPVLMFNSEGEMEVIEKIRTSKKVYAYYVNYIEQELQQRTEKFDVRIGHTDSLEEAKILSGLIKDKFGDQFSRQISILTPVLGSHGGKGVIGVGIFPYVNTN